MVISTNLDYVGSLISSYFLEKKYTALKLIRAISGIQLIPYIKFAYHYNAVGSDERHLSLFQRGFFMLTYLICPKIQIFLLLFCRLKKIRTCFTFKARQACIKGP